MGNLIAFGFDRFRVADEVLNKLRSETAIKDAFVVERGPSERCEKRRVQRAFITYQPKGSRRRKRVYGLRGHESDRRREGWR